MSTLDPDPRGQGRLGRQAWAAARYWIIEPGQNLAFGPETLEQKAAFVTASNQLDRDLELVLSVGAAGAVHLAHSTATQLLEELVRTDAAPAHLRRGQGRCGIETHDRGVEEFPVGGIGLEQAVDFVSELRVVAARGFEITRARLRVERQRDGKHRLDLLPAFRSHTAVTVRPALTMTRSARSGDGAMRARSSIPATR
jgi:hypothetical protein